MAPPQLPRHPTHRAPRAPEPSWQLRSLRRALGFMVLLCGSIAILLTALSGGGFLGKLLYSFCIGLSCWACTDGARLLTEWLLDRARRLRGQPPSPPGGSIGWVRLAPAFLIGAWGGTALGLTIADAISGLRSPSLLDMSSPASRVTLAITVLASAVAWLNAAGRERLAAERERAERLERQAAQSELMLLQSQLEPHMLFNTLANLRVLIAMDPTRAQAMLDHLIAFLRATLNASRAAAHPLSAEFDRIADYLALMAVRMGPRLQVRLDLPDEMRLLPVPPLLLQPLVENAILHGLEPHVEGGSVEVTARRDGMHLALQVRDTGVGLPSAGGVSATAGTGFGLAQVRERLATLHGPAASLTLEPANDPRGGTQATLRLPWPETSI